VKFARFYIYFFTYNYTFALSKKLINIIIHLNFLNMKKVLFLFTFLAFTLMGVNAQSSGTTGYWDLQGNTGTGSRNFIGTSDNMPIIFKTSGAERMQLLSNKAFLGIGVSTPQATLHLHYSSGGFNPPNFQKLLQLTTDATGINANNGFYISSDRVTKDITFKQQEQNAKFFIEGPNGGLVIASDGNIGLGTNAPQEKLHINEGNLLFSKDSASTSQGEVLFKVKTASYFSTWGIEQIYSNGAGGGLNFWNLSGALVGNGENSSEKSTILFLSNVLTGRVGIGTTNPSARLDVAGSFKARRATIDSTLTANDLKVTGLLCAKEVRVQLSGAPCWPDNVFSQEYNLLPLSEVEGFINANQHLPNIPSAAEVEENGVELGEMNAKLLQKIEELTLYIINLQKQIDELKK
jgi:hypothetical protein